jgi:hypothetical protein
MLLRSLFRFLTDRELDRLRAERARLTAACLSARERGDTRAHHAAERHSPLAVRDHRHPRFELPVDAVECAHRLARRRAAHDALRTA